MFLLGSWNKLTNICYLWQYILMLLVLTRRQGLALWKFAHWEEWELDNPTSFQNFRKSHIMSEFRSVPVYRGGVKVNFIFWSWITLNLLNLQRRVFLTGPAPCVTLGCSPRSSLSRSCLRMRGCPSPPRRSGPPWGSTRGWARITYLLCKFGILGKRIVPILILYASFVQVLIGR